MALSKFGNSVLAALKLIPPGKVTTYQEIAKYLKRPKAYRAVGNALNKNSYVPKMPCHRVIRSNGQIGGYAFGKTKKIKLLEQEKINIKQDRIINFSKIFLKLK
ncbi:cysteine methyltransferase [Candidatus Falkowbacteria bacterium CG_4_9_14_3_um_filter_38_19]|uniref:Cysteine methyltransferase n=2 Tax=Candidatus Falkowiibacteriota TaxID=1752728 RepID=A0A2M6WS37_9BACT|nr:MAG: cysteine methyltransferase [Candidatus Falkowbacteria bacterium CG10_big_fil_rev_8_21_14_0_10_38_22]PJB16692.1 MAG: cysteine methyltransferase [Candidatus Falkowbacteria bacterium CG_4_9_14_3_um_filter_38_19]